MTRYAEVAVDAPIGHSRTFSYSIPDRFRLEPGQLVWVPFGRRILQGLVIELTAAPSFEKTKDILQPVDPGRLLDDTAIALAQWLSRYYLCSLFQAIALFLPPGFKAQVRSQILPLPGDAVDREKLKAVSLDALSTLADRRRMNEVDFAKLLGRPGIREVNRLVDQGFVHRRVDLPRPRTFRYDSLLFPAGNPDSLGNWPAAMARVSPRQENLLQAVREQGGGYSTTVANREFGQGVGDALVEKGLLMLEWVRQESRVVDAPDLAAGEPESHRESERPPQLTTAQADALTAIVETLEDSSQRPRTFLLHGVTGSGKTEVYLRAIAKVVERGAAGAVPGAGDFTDPSDR